MVGCCARIAHIAPVLWYLGFEHHQPARKISKTHDKYMDALTNAAVWDTYSDSSDEVIQNEI